MLGILVVSHGSLARGLVESARCIFGATISALEYCCLDTEGDYKKFDRELNEAVRRLRSNDGLVILTDVAGGYCFNKAVTFVSRGAKVIAGVNMPLLLELLTRRNSGSDIDLGFVTERARKGIISAEEYLSQQQLNIE